MLTILNQHSLRRFTSWHAFVLLGVFFSYLVNVGFAYHNLSYLNLFFVIYALVKHPNYRQLITGLPISTLVLIPIFLIIIQFLAAGNIYLIKPIRALLIAAAIGTAIRLCFEFYPENNKQYVYKTILGLLFIFVLVQTYTVFFLKHPYGTFKNPHYLSQCCLLLLPIVVYLLSKATYFIKYLLVVFAFLLAALLLHNPSRPAWIGVIVGAMLTLMHFSGKKRIMVLITLIFVPCILYLMDISNFGNKLYELYAHIQTEERVAIWHDTWKMQLGSDFIAWLFGHGLDSFYDNFKPYSTYHLKEVDFNSPHNFFLELLYISGVVGLGLVIIFFVILYTKLLRQYRINRDALILLLIVLLTSNLIFVSLTLPFYTKYNLNIVAIVTALLFSAQGQRGVDECKN